MILIRSLVALWLLSAPAGAAEGRSDRSCADPDFNERRMALHLDQARRAMSGATLNEARRALATVGSSLPCLPEVVSQPALARFARLMSEASFYRQEDAASVRWGLIARLIEPENPWSSLEADHPLRTRLDSAELPPIGGPPDQGLAPPPGGAIFLNGALALRAEAHAELPYLVQLLDPERTVVAGYWQDGAVFPELLLSPTPEPYAVPDWIVNGQVQRPSSVPLARSSSRSVPLAPVLTGGALAIASVTTYALSSAAYGRVPDQPSADEADQLRGRAHALALVSGISAAGALGIGVGGVLLSPTGASFSLRF